MTLRDRRDYVDYWALNAIPLKGMFEAFRQIFISEVQRKRIFKITPLPDDKPYNEMTDKQVHI